MLRCNGPQWAPSFLRDDSKKPMRCMVAGGTGFAPIKSDRRARHLPQNCQRPITVYWGAPNQRD
jgi:NAD(P)H-flavin reductase